MTDLPVVLASASPRRHDLLNMIGISHDVMPADIDESYRDGERPRAYAERLAREKGALVAATRRDSLVISADTIVVIDGRVLGKPASAAEADRMLRQLSGRTHEVVTAVAATLAGRTESGVEEVRVTFRQLSAELVARYVATGEPLDKAGAYGIQGFGATIVERIEGDYFAVMGLALGRLIELVGGLGLVYGFDGVKRRE
ncbi:MAG: Maf family protein [Gemmatimonadota bacterium]|nr:Maf family protein [Gemmatimonadota bacterium]